MLLGTEPQDLNNIILVNDDVIGMYKDHFIRAKVIAIEAGCGLYDLTAYYLHLSEPLEDYGDYVRLNVHPDYWKDWAMADDDFLLTVEYYQKIKDDPLVQKYLRSLTKVDE